MLKPSNFITVLPQKKSRRLLNVQQDKQSAAPSAALLTSLSLIPDGGRNAITVVGCLMRRVNTLVQLIETTHTLVEMYETLATLSF